MFKEPVHMIELKEKYQGELAYREETLRSWRCREGWRSFFRAMTVIFLLAGIAVAAWFVYDYRNSSGYDGYIFAGIAIGITVIVLILNGIVRHALSNACRRAFDRFWKADVRSQREFDQIKREKVDPVLENQIVVSVASTLSTFATYVYEDKHNKFIDNTGVEIVPAKSRKNNPPKLWRGPVSAATAYIDDVEVGAIDVSADSLFTTFRVTPGLHTLKLKIRRDYVDLDKSLEILTPALTFTVNGDYHIVNYRLDASLNERGVLKYTLRTEEFDDMVTYVREARGDNNYQFDHNKTILSEKLQRRSYVLYRELYPDDETEEEFLVRELKGYGPEALLMGDVAKKLEAARVDARIQQNNKIEIFATLRRDKGDR